MKRYILALILFLCISGSAYADIYNIGCSSYSNTIYYKNNGTYEHAWVYVNGIQKGDFWTTSSGSGTFVTNINSADQVFILFYNGNYGQNNATCD